MSKKIVKVKISSIQQYIKLVNGIFRLTDKEIEVMAEFVRMKKQYPKINIFSADFKKTIAEELGMSHFNVLNIYLKSLKDKGAIVKDNGYSINKLLLLEDDQNGLEFKWKNEEQ